MPRDLPLSNGRLHVNFDSRYNLRDIYFPHVGEANHAYGCTSRMGIRVDGAFSWLDSPEWERDLRYAKDTLVTDVRAVNQRLGISLRIQDAVDFHRNLLVRNVEVINDGDRPRDIRVFQHLDFSFWGTTVGDSVAWLPDRRAIVGYQNRAYLLLGGSANGRSGLASWSMDHKDPAGLVGSWRDAEDGLLDERTVAVGSVDCIGAIDIGVVSPGGSAAADIWIGVGATLDEVCELDDLVRERGAESFRKRTDDYWRAWSKGHSDVEITGDDVPEWMAEALRRSLLVLRTAVDEQGGIIASTDSDIFGPYSPSSGSGAPADAEDTDSFVPHEHYGYVWPRDSAMIGLALGRAGYVGLSQKLLAFCDRVLEYDPTRDWGYLFQRYYPGGAVASSYIPWVDGFGRSTDAHGVPRLPIQEDETALIMVLLWDHFERYRDWELVTSLYLRFIKPIGNLLRDYRHRETGLPLPSNDLWEERDGIHAYTVATVWAGLQAAARFMELFGEDEAAHEYRTAADEIKAATEQRLYDETKGRFVRSLMPDADGNLSQDPIIDVSMYALWYFGMFDVDDPRIERTMDAAIERLTLKTPSGGMARYEGDVYQQVPAPNGGAPEVGNPWFICTLWIADYRIRKAKTLADLEPALEILQWAHTRALPSGVMAEQLDPHTGTPISATPLTWSHATLVSTIFDYLQRHRELTATQS